MGALTTEGEDGNKGNKDPLKEKNNVHLQAVSQSPVSSSSLGKKEFWKDAKDLVKGTVVLRQKAPKSLLFEVGIFISLLKQQARESGLLA